MSYIAIIPFLCGLAAAIPVVSEPAGAPAGAPASVPTSAPAFSLPVSLALSLPLSLPLELPTGSVPIPIPSLTTSTTALPHVGPPSLAASLPVRAVEPRAASAPAGGPAPTPSTDGHAGAPTGPAGTPSTDGHASVPTQSTSSFLGTLPGHIQASPTSRAGEASPTATGAAPTAPAATAPAATAPAATAPTATAPAATAPATTGPAPNPQDLIEQLLEELLKIPTEAVEATIAQLRQELKALGFDF